MQDARFMKSQSPSINAPFVQKKITLYDSREDSGTSWSIKLVEFLAI